MSLIENRIKNFMNKYEKDILSYKLPNDPYEFRSDFDAIYNSYPGRQYSSEQYRYFVDLWDKLGYRTSFGKVNGYLRRVIKMIPKGYAFITNLRDDRLLVVRVNGTKNWSFPGGKIEKSDKNHKAGMIRELHEEIGLSFRPEELTKLFTIGDNSTYYRATIPIRKVRIDHKEIVQAKWVSPDDIPTLTRRASLAFDHWMG